MHQEKYNLIWHSYSDHLKIMMKELMMNEEYSDVTLVTEDKKHIQANIHILIACSPVFKDILKRDKNSSPIVYLRGIQYSELESIMQFIYLGEATFYEERMDEFLAVAKSLEIKELCNAVTEAEIKKPSPSVPATLSEEGEDRIIVSDELSTQDRRREVVRIKDKYECDQCRKTYSDKKGLSRHTQSYHEGVKYHCDQCDYQARYQGDLNRHTQSTHEGIKYACNQCDYQATRQDNLTTHIQNMHDGIKYSCNYCDHQAYSQSKLSRHIKSQH